MTDPDDLNIDDLVTDDDLEPLKDAIESVREEAVTEDPLEDGDVDGLVETKVRSMLEHLAFEDCDTEGCNEIRSQFGIGGDVDHDHDPEESVGNGDENGEEVTDGEQSGGDGGDETNGGGDGDDGSWPPEGW